MSPNEVANICVICTVWNAENWIGKCIDSIRNQSYEKFYCAIVDDCSDDATYSICLEKTDGDKRFVVQQNESRIRSIANQLRAVERIASHSNDVLVIVDGDDWLKHDDVFEQIATLYSNDNLWLTYGSYQLWRNRLTEKLGRRCERGHVRPYPEYVTNHNLYRYYPFMASHLRTFRRFLWDQIGQDALKDDTGEYLQVAHDFAAMIPMLEMAGPAHSRYIDDMLYVYNRKNPRSIHRSRPDDEHLAELKIRAKPRHWPL